MSGFIYPIELLGEVKRELATRPPARSGNLVVPPDSVLLRLFEVSYHASFLREEGRPLVFQVAYYSPALATDTSSGRPHVKFDVEMPFDAQQVRRLAPATDPTTAYLNVMDTGRQGKAEDIHIWGIGYSEPEWWAREVDIPSSMTSMPPALIVRVDDPGTLTVSWADHLLVTLRNGVMAPRIEDILEFALFGDFFTPAMRALLVAVYGSAVDALPIEQKEAIATEISDLFLDSLRRLLSRARIRSHGALFLIVSETSAIARGHSAGLHIKYPAVSSTDIFPLLVEKAIAVKEMNAAARGYIDSHHAETFFKSDHRNSGSGVRLRRQLDAVADLAVVDGAVLLTDRLRLIGFAVEVQIDSPMTEVYIAPTQGRGGRKEPIQNHGTRHRSAFRFCDQNPDSVAFVLSQDGGIRAVRKVEELVLLWTEVRATGDLSS